MMMILRLHAWYRRYFDCLSLSNLANITASLPVSGKVVRGRCAGGFFHLWSNGGLPASSSSSDLVSSGSHRSSSSNAEMLWLTAFNNIAVHPPPFPGIEGSQPPPKTPIENCAETSAHRGIVCMEGLQDFLFFFGGGGDRECRHSQGLPDFLATPVISGTDKATDFKLCTHIHKVDRNKSPCKNFGESSRGRSQGVPKFFRAAPIYRAHRAVIFTIV